MCLWCYHHILEEANKESLPARCPNCRSDYDQNKIQMQHIDAAALEEEKRKLREKDRSKGTALTPGLRSRGHLANMRVVQQNLVYAVGIPLEICTEEILRGNDFFGSFGKAVKISVNRSNQYASALAKHGPTGSAYVTFKRSEDALRCIKALDGAAWAGKPIKACFGTTKYCNAFLKGVPCNNPDCLYLHELADDDDCLTKEEVAAGLLPARFLAMGATNTFKPRLTIHQIPNAQTAAAQAAAAAAAAAGHSQAQITAAAAAAGGISRPVGMPQRPSSGLFLEAHSPTNQHDTASMNNDNAPSIVAPLGTTASWAAVSAAQSMPPPPPPPPPAVPSPANVVEWPELAGVSGMSAAQADDSSSYGRVEIPTTMAEQLAKAHTAPKQTARAQPAKKLLPLASPAKLKPLTRAPSLGRPASPSRDQSIVAGIQKLSVNGETGDLLAPGATRLAPPPGFPAASASLQPVKKVAPPPGFGRPSSPVCQHNSSDSISGFANGGSYYISSENGGVAPNSLTSQCSSSSSNNPNSNSSSSTNNNNHGIGGSRRERSRFAFAQEEGGSYGGSFSHDEGQRRVSQDPSAFLRSIFPGVNVNVTSGAAAERQQQSYSRSALIDSTPPLQHHLDAGGMPPGLALLKQLQGSGAPHAQLQQCTGFDDPAIMRASKVTEKPIIGMPYNGR